MTDFLKTGLIITSMTMSSHASVYDSSDSDILEDSDSDAVIEIREHLSMDCNQELILRNDIRLFGSIVGPNPEEYDDTVISFDRGPAKIIGENPDRPVILEVIQDQPEDVIEGLPDFDENGVPQKKIAGSILFINVEVQHRYPSRRPYNSPVTPNPSDDEEGSPISNAVLSSSSEDEGEIPFSDDAPEWNDTLTPTRNINPFSPPPSYLNYLINYNMFGRMSF